MFESQHTQCGERKQNLNKLTWEEEWKLRAFELNAVV